jgi:hypothetical protein
MPLIYKEVEVDIDLDDFNDDELLDELERRNIAVGAGDPEQVKELVYTMYEKFRQQQNIDQELREFFWQSLGRIA